MEPEFRLMMVLGVQYIFLIIWVCACAHLCACVWHEEWDIKAVWLLAELEWWWWWWRGVLFWGLGGSSHLEFLLISPHTPTLAWLPFTHMIKHHDAGMDVFFAYSYPPLLFCSLVVALWVRVYMPPTFSYFILSRLVCSLCRSLSDSSWGYLPI